MALLAIRHYSQVQFNLADWSAQDPNIANLGLWTALKGYSYMASLYLKGQIWTPTGTSEHPLDASSIVPPTHYTRTQQLLPPELQQSPGII